ncbi:hypothetical protein SCLCIDRAFT_128105 [Scleroderma citrinum Foug A]|uniref:Uncharacterized protein n=1 Tax=Scleroderma citrinum Foug A TaxID=1036808 RepID=A0A0C3DQN9_9AGAM|nr:hypothetical protein SCLCIDRAFT_128105 [Scleroderma citrinum Foug A]
MAPRNPFQGHARKLVLAFDVGTTYSGVSYCILDPGEIPEIHGVTRYPAQEYIEGDNKIPSILYYDQEYTVRAIGAEALQEHIIEQAQDENWIKVVWWKLHLRPKHLLSSHIRDDDIPPLPEGLSAVQVLSDFMKYLFNCAQNFIVESHASGASMWKSLENQIEFVLTHPNGWEGPQQQQIRQAAELAGLVPSGEKGKLQLHLLTEGEASLHFCMMTTLDSGTKYEDYQSVAVIDAGGGTIDVSTYCVASSPGSVLSVKEISPAAINLQGSIFVTLRAQQFLQNKLANSPYGAPEVVEQMANIFDKTTKLRFRNAGDPQYIKFGTIRDKDPENDIRAGQLKIPGDEVAKFFEPSIEAIVEVFDEQQKAACMPIGHAFLVGGYAANDFLFTRLKLHPKFSHVTLCRPPNRPNKAVADGAISYNIDHLVTTRVAKLTYGIHCTWMFDSSQSDHVSRKDTLFRELDGSWRLPNAFSSILKKGTQVSEQQEFRHSFFQLRESATDCASICTTLVVYRGMLHAPCWKDIEPSAFMPNCRILADTSAAAAALLPKKSPEGKTYYHIDFDVILLFGLTELKAQISWLENVCTSLF